MTLPKLTAALEEFSVERDWEKFHNPKNFAAALLVEAGELMDPFIWLEGSESGNLPENPEVKAYLTKEVGDVLINLLQFCRLTGIDPEQAAWDKLEKLKQRYDVETHKGVSFRVKDNSSEALFPTLAHKEKVENV
jgi:NTP pyrophosphatase (non-canonical NTP hydrolase)